MTKQMPPPTRIRNPRSDGQALTFAELPLFATDDELGVALLGRARCGAISFLCLSGRDYRKTTHKWAADTCRR